VADEREVAVRLLMPLLDDPPDHRDEEEKRDHPDQAPDDPRLAFFEEHGRTSYRR
jgi:hypothetical protein